MMKYYPLAIGFSLLIALLSIAACSKSEDKIVPAKAFSTINIRDGEFLHYGNYIEGKKYADYYLVNKAITNQNGNVLYRTYFNAINVDDAGNAPGDYTNWPAYLLIDPKLGSVVESGGKFSTNILNHWIGRLGKLVRWDFKYNSEKNEVEYTSAAVKGTRTNISKMRIKVLPGVPVEDMWMDLFIASRIIDFRGGGLVSFVNPEYFTVPLVYIKSEESRKKIDTKAGAFNVINLTSHPGRYTFSFMIDGMRSLLVNPDLIAYTAQHTNDQPEYYYEDSERKLIVREHTVVGGGDWILEGISNVNKK